MKNHSFTPARCTIMLALGAMGLGVGASLLTVLSSPAQAAPKQTLEIWPGQRVLLVLPLTVGENWNGGPELAEAIKPLLRPVVQKSLTDTGKFSVTLPYRFDPILRRAVVENRISQDIITPFVDTPSLETAQPVFSQLKFEQVPMVTAFQLEEIRVGGTQSRPTAQLQMSAKLYEIGGAGPFRNVVVTSDAMQGRTPAERLKNAAANASRQIAAYFVKPPETFQLPTSLTADGSRSGAGMPLINQLPSINGMSGIRPTSPSTQPNGVTGVPVIPMLPPTQPPLGIDPGGEKALSR